MASRTASERSASATSTDSFKVNDGGFAREGAVLDAKGDPVLAIGGNRCNRTAAAPLQPLHAHHLPNAYFKFECGFAESGAKY